MKALALIISFSCLSTPIYASSVLFSQNQELNQRMNKTWGTKRESVLVKPLLYAPRLVSHTVRDVVQGRTVHRVVKTVEAPIDAVTDGRKALYDVSDSLVNVPADIEDAGADIVGAAKNVVYAVAPSSKRLRLCTSNLITNFTNKITPLQFVNPMFHIGTVLDGMLYETTDESANPDELRSKKAHDGLICHDIPLLENVPESVAIEKLLCVDQVFNQRYNFATYNCGGYTKDVLNMAGLGYPSFVNWGIGAEFKYIANSKEYKEHKSKARAYCNERIANIRELLSGIESGEKVTDQIAKLDLSNMQMSPDLAFQLLVSGARNNSTETLEIGAKALNAYDTNEMTKAYLNKKGQIRGRLRPLFKSLAFGLTEDQLKLISEHHETAAQILKGSITPEK